MPTITASERSIMTFILQMKRAWFREDKVFTPNYTSDKCQSWNPDLKDTKVTAQHYILYP